MSIIGTIKNDPSAFVEVALGFFIFAVSAAHAPIDSKQRTGLDLVEPGHEISWP